MTLAIPERQQAPAVIPMPNRAGPISLTQMTPQDAWKFAEVLAGTPLLPDAYRKQPASVLWAMEYGRALGLDVVTTITTIHVIKGKPTQSADLMLSRARQAGHRIRIKAERTRCVVKVVRADDPDDETEIEWTLDDAVTARLCEMRNDRPYARDQKNQPTSWEKYPRAMLRSRAIAEAVRTACPEVLHGAIYTPEELGAVVDQDGNAVADAPATPPYVESTVVERPATPTATDRDADRDVSRDTAPSRDWIAEAQAAADAAAVRALYEEAGRAGASRDIGRQIAEIGATKPGAKPKPPATEQPRTATPHSMADAEAASGAYDDVTDAAGENGWAAAEERAHTEADADRAHAAAENSLRLAASRAQLNTLDADFERAYGLPIGESPAFQIDAFRAEIERALGGAR